MKAYKTKETIGYIEKGRIVCPINGQHLVIATYTKPQWFTSNYFIEKSLQQGLLETIDLIDEEKSHPHLYKPIKEEIYKLKNN